MDTVFDGFKYAELITAKNHDEAIAYVDKYLKLNPDDPQLKRTAAYARGAKAEHILMSCDQLGVAPDQARTDKMIAILEEAIHLDPSIPDLYWDLAVIYGRFLKNYASSSHYLDEAKKRDYHHPMMKALEDLISVQG